MPLMRCGKDGQGWKYGENGKCYIGKDAKKKAIKQGLAINDGKWAEAAYKDGFITDDDLEEILFDKDSTSKEVSLAMDIMQLDIIDRMTIDSWRR